MKTTIKSVKLCEACGGENTKTHLTTYPIEIGEKQINVGRVSMRECMDCHAMTPTKSGKEKIGRCMITFMSVFGK
jgi:YgiT-type zinc finger domain-containing protein